MFSDRLKKLRKDRGITQAEFANKFQISNGTIGNWEAGSREPDMQTLQKIADYFDVSTDYLLGRENQPTIPQPSVPGSKWIPVLGKVQAGAPVEAIEDIIDYEEITPEMAKSGEFFALQIRGESMQPRFDEGDVVIVRKQDDVESGEIAVVLVNGEDATVKKLFKQDGGISLVSTNPSFAPIFFNNEKIKTLPVSVIGRVVELRAKF